MTERPILFAGEMVRAILAGRKTQTRRAITTQWFRCLDPDDAEDRLKAVAQCPIGVPGDRLWVRETWYCDHVEAKPKGTAEEIEGWRRMLFYGADYANAQAWAQADEWAEGPPGWRPSIHMPRWASRLLLEITAVRIERLQDISEQDAQAEGLGPVDARWAFRELWEALYSKTTPWADNPWVWVIEFKRIEEGR